MAAIGVSQKMDTLKLQHQPRLTGKVLSEADDTVLLQAGGCVVEIPPRHITERTPKGDLVELTLSCQAEVLVSTPVSVQKGFLADNVFGAILPILEAGGCGLCACNNCRCNCNVHSSLEAGPCSDPKCNCNCNECRGDINVVPESPVVPPVRLFRKPFTGGGRQASTG